VKLVTKLLCVCENAPFWVSLVVKNEVELLSAAAFKADRELSG
jgi:hypothetical protein